MKRRVCVLALAATLLGVSGLSGQEPTDPAVEEEGPVLVGRVFDAANGRPLVGAFVHLYGADWGVLTNAEGVFRLPEVHHGTLMLAVEQLGYADLVENVEFAQGAPKPVFTMIPDPILLEGIRVMMDRFERRRRASATSVRVLDREDLVEATAFDLVDLIRSQSFLHPTLCPSEIMESLCAVVRGRVRPVTVYMDELPMLGGLDFLSLVQPHELHLVEIYHSRGHVRVYTEDFMERVGRRPMALGW